MNASIQLQSFSSQFNKPLQFQKHSQIFLLINKYTKIKEFSHFGFCHSWNEKISLIPIQHSSAFFHFCFQVFRISFEFSTPLFHSIQIPVMWYISYIINGTRVYIAHFFHLESNKCRVLNPELHFFRYLPFHIV